MSLYRDYGALDRRYFEGDAVDDPHPAGYSDYRRDLPFNKHGDATYDWLDAGHLNPETASVLIVGCGYGFTVKRLYERGVDAWGMDLSEYAVTNAPDAVNDRVLQGNVLQQPDLARLAETASIDTFDAVIDEGVLCFLSDDGAVTACENLRAVGELVIHRVWTNADLVSETSRDWYNVKALDDWRALCDPEKRDDWYPNRAASDGEIDGSN